ALNKSAASDQAAINALGVSINNLIGGAAVQAASTSTQTTSLAPTTWKGLGNIYSSNPFNGNPLVTNTQEITVVFTPTSATTGTFTSSPLYVFGVGGDHLAFDLHGTQFYSASVPYTVCSRSYFTGHSLFNPPTGTYGGRYEINGDSIWTFPTSAVGSPCVAPPPGFFGSLSHRTGVSNHATTMTLTNEDGTQVVLNRQ
ncbi:MAG: hypothetical protein HY976_03820, partial [Candidatus Kerfeldbacteria bacterium]|nr:hypothetical protein [Candidatus Kerfeldbacteria bacterium]